jgi:AIR synthase related protein domain protein
MRQNRAPFGNNASHRAFCFPLAMGVLSDEKTAVSPWLEAFINARKWIEARNAEK